MRSVALAITLALAAVSVAGCGVVDSSEGSVAHAAAQALFRAMGGAPEPSAAEPPDSSRAASQAARAAEPERAERPTSQAAPEDPPSDPGKRVYYQFVDASGTVRFVEDLAAVPPAQRARAGRIELGVPDPAPRRSTPPARRAFQYTPPPAPKVVVYTAPWCGWCRRTLEHLDERRVRYENRDIERNPAFRRELIEKTGGASIPVVEINGHRVDGYDPQRIDRLLASNS